MENVCINYYIYFYLPLEIQQINIKPQKNISTSNNELPKPIGNNIFFLIFFNLLL